MPLTIVTVLMPFYKSADTLSRFRGHPFTIPRTPFHDSADTHSRFRGHPCTIPRTPLLDSADTRTRFRGYPRRCRRKTADFRRGQSADFVKFLVTSTVCAHVHIQMACRPVHEIVLQCLHTVHDLCTCMHTCRMHMHTHEQSSFNEYKSITYVCTHCTEGRQCTCCSLPAHHTSNSLRTCDHDGLCIPSQTVF